MVLPVTSGSQEAPRAKPTVCQVSKKTPDLVSLTFVLTLKPPVPLPSACVGDIRRRRPERSRAAATLGAMTRRSLPGHLPSSPRLRLPLPPSRNISAPSETRSIPSYWDQGLLKFPLDDAEGNCTRYCFGACSCLQLKPSCAQTLLDRSLSNPKIKRNLLNALALFHSAKRFYFRNR